MWIQKLVSVSVNETFRVHELMRATDSYMYICYLPHLYNLIGKKEIKSELFSCLI